LANSFSWGLAFLPLYLFGLIRLGATLPQARPSFYWGLGIGLGIFAPQLNFFWSLFGATSACLWLVLAFWTGLFVSLVNVLWRRLGGSALWLVPFLWMGIEYCRSELYYLKFSWLTPAYAFAESSPHLARVGVYGIGFGVAAVAAFLVALRLRGPGTFATGFLASAFGIAILTGWNSPPARASLSSVAVAGMQLEFPATLELPEHLDALVRRHPEAELLVLSEYTLDGPVPPCVMNWCRRNERYLILGGKSPLSATTFRNTAFVVGPTGEIVFEQAKVVPIQFFSDGEPAPDQRVWESPWGRIGICICYDLSYTRVTDRLIELGAQALIVPTMDVMDWGKHQHLLHSRIAPMRAAEYEVPIFRVASSGVSQLIDGYGRSLSCAAIGAEGATIAGKLELPPRGTLPTDRWLAPISTFVAFLVLVYAMAWRKPTTRSGVVL
jgi:apolipoprotein N-acyltransferase